MKKIILFSCALLLIFSCKKDKLEGEKSILQGKWKWVGATETRTVLSNGNYTTVQRNASEFSNEYFVEFERKGNVSFIENTTVSDCFRVVFSIFTDNCNMFNNCNQVDIYLDNKTDQQFDGFVNADTLTFWCSLTNLPLQTRTEEIYRYSYQYFYVKAN